MTSMMNCLLHKRAFLMNFLVLIWTGAPDMVHNEWINYWLYPLSGVIMHLPSFQTAVNHNIMCMHFQFAIILISTWSMDGGLCGLSIVVDHNIFFAFFLLWILLLLIIALLFCCCWKCGDQRSHHRWISSLKVQKGKQGGHSLCQYSPNIPREVRIWE